MRKRMIYCYFDVKANLRLWVLSLLSVVAVAASAWYTGMVELYPAAGFMLGVWFTWGAYIWYFSACRRLNEQHWAEMIEEYRRENPA